MKKLSFRIPKEEHAANMLALRYGIKLDGEWLKAEVAGVEENEQPGTSKYTVNYKDSEGVEHQFILIYNSEGGFAKTVLPVKGWSEQFDDSQNVMFHLLQRDEEEGHKNDRIFLVDEILDIRKEIIDKTITYSALREKVKKKGGYVGDDPKKEEKILNLTPYREGDYYISQPVKLMECGFTKNGYGMITIEGLVRPLFMSPKWSTLQEVMEKVEKYKGKYVRIETKLKTRGGEWEPTEWFYEIIPVEESDSASA